MGVFQSQLAVTCCGRNCEHVLCGHNGPCQASPGHEIVIYVAKKIRTMDPGWPEATAVAVQEGRIVSVGDVESLTRVFELTGRRYRVDYTLADQVLLPGFIEQHNHPLVGGTAMSLLNISSNPTPNPFGEDYSACMTKEEVIQRMKEEDKKLPPGQDLNAWGWDSVVLKGHLHKKDLDQISTTRVVSVWDRSLHCGYCNTYAMKLLGLDAKKWGKVPGVICDEDGELAGQFLALQALAALRPLFGKVLQPKRACHSIRYMTELARQNGITTMSEMMLGGVQLTLEGLLYKHFFNAPDCPVRCVCTVEAGKAIKACLGSTSWAVKWVAGLQKTSTPNLIFNNGVKFFADDAFVALTMQVGYPGYLDGREGLWNSKQGDHAVKAMLPWWKAGCRIHVHSNGDAAQDATAEVLQALQRNVPRFDHRFCFEHYGLSSESTARRLKSLGASAACNIYYPYYRGEVNEAALGPDRAHTASRVRTLITHKVPVAMHTDSPIAPPKPLEEIWFAVNRKLESGKVLAPAERVNIEEAVRMKTVDAAYVLGLDDLIGSISAGKFADFTVLTDDPFAVAEQNPEKLRDIQVWGTVLGGKLRPKADKWKLNEVPPEGLIPGVLWLAARETSGYGPWVRAAASFALTQAQSSEACCRTLLRVTIALLLVAGVWAKVFGGVCIPAILLALATGASVLRFKRRRAAATEPDAEAASVERKSSSNSNGSTSTSESGGLSNSDSDEQKSPNGTKTASGNTRRRPPQRK
eukprot:Hpha_TRINITY_DN14610_c1_g3::TRINITY_DN14610_c1_g3_i1::g.48296::m.48296